MQRLHFPAAACRRVGQAILAGLTTMSLALTASAATFNAVDDAYTRDNQPSENFGTHSLIWVQQWSNTNAFVRFDLRSAPTAADVSSAYLRIPVKDVVSGGVVDLHRVWGSFDEGSLTHSNKPSYSKSLAQVSIDASHAGKTVSVNVTNLVKQMLARGTESIAFVTGNANVSFGSHEGGTPIRLDIETSGGSGGSTPGMPAVADAFTRSADSNKNFGSQTNLRTMQWADTTSYVRFNLGSVPAGSDAESAVLHLRLARVDKPGTITVHRVLGNWNESSLTHANRPSYGGALASFNVTTSLKGSTIAVDATALAKALLSNRSNNYGIAFVSSNANIGINSRESGSPVRLEVEATSGGGGSNRAPTISGNPPSEISPGSSFNFTPSASDPDGDSLTFSIANRPAWANFNPTTGRLYGTPTTFHIGDYSNIAITVSDGQQSATLGPFAVEVTSGGNGEITLSWRIPTQNTDGTPLTDLARFRIDWTLVGGESQGEFVINNSSVSSYTIDTLPNGTYDFTIVAINSQGVASVPSNSARATIN